MSNVDASIAAAWAVRAAYAGSSPKKLLTEGNPPQLAASAGDLVEAFGSTHPAP